jgi:hypothetical protein
MAQLSRPTFPHRGQVASAWRDAHPLSAGLSVRQVVTEWEKKREAKTAKH